MRHTRLMVVLAAAPLLWQGCATTTAPTLSSTTPVHSPAFNFQADKLTALDALVEQGIADHRMPGAVVWLEHDGAVYQKVYGLRAWEPETEPMTADTIFDAASLTKVLATTPAVMLLVQRGLLDVEAPVQKYIEEFRRGGKDAITVRQLLTHTSGLRADLTNSPAGQRAGVAMACQEVTINPPGTHFLYSDINFLLLGEIVQRVSSKPFEQFCTDEIYRPLKMNDTRFLPLTKDKPRVAPTARDGTNMLRGTVHDPTARGMGGVAGHAGLFTTTADVARFARMMLNQGELDGVRLFRAQTVSLMTSVQSPVTMTAKRGFGWDIDTGFSRRGKAFPVGSYGHTGYTGTALWIDPFTKTFWVLMTNRVHPNDKADIRALQSSFSTLAAEAAGLAPMAVPAPAN